MKFFSNKSFNQASNYSNSTEDILYGAIKIGYILGTKSVEKSTSLSGGREVISFGNTREFPHYLNRRDALLHIYICSNYQEKSSILFKEIVDHIEGNYQ